MSRTNTTTSPTSLDAWAMLRRHRMRFAVAAFAGAVFALTAGFFLPRQYQADAVFERRNDMVLTEITNTGASRSFQNPRQSLVKELTGDVSIDATVDRVAEVLAQQGRILGLIDRDRLRADLRRKLHVSFDFASDPADRVRLAFTGSDPVIAQVAVNTLVEIYIEQTRRALDARLSESATFFTGQVTRCREEIAELEDKLLAFEIEHTELMPDNPGGLQSAVADMQKALIDARQAHESARLQVQTLRRQLEATPPTTPTVTRTKNPELIRLEDRLRQLTEQRTRHLMVDRMRPEHPDVLIVDQQIAAVTQQITDTDVEVISATTHTDNPRHAQLTLLLAQAESEQIAAAGQVEALQKELADAAEKTDALYPVRAEYKALSRQVQQAQRQLNFWEDNLRRVQMTLSAESGNRGVQFTFLKPSGAIRRPVSPNFKQVVMAALMASIATGVLSVFIAHRADRSIDDPDKLASTLGVPLLGAVGPVVTAAQQRLQWLRTWVVMPTQMAAMAAIVLVLAGVSYVALERPDLWHRVREKSQQWSADRGMAMVSSANPQTPR